MTRRRKGETTGADAPGSGQAVPGRGHLGLLSGRRPVRLSPWVVAGASLALFVISGVAWACIPQATMTMDQSAAEAGETVSGSGSGFRPGVPVEIRWDDMAGELLWRGPPSSVDGKVNFSFAVPTDAQPGYYTVLGYQSGSVDEDRSPARTTLQVVGQEASHGGTSPTDPDSDAATSEDGQGSNSIAGGEETTGETGGGQAAAEEGSSGTEETGGQQAGQTGDEGTAAQEPAGDTSGSEQSSQAGQTSDADPAASSSSSQPAASPSAGDSATDSSDAQAPAVSGQDTGGQPAPDRPAAAAASQSAGDQDGGERPSVGRAPILAEAVPAPAEAVPPPEVADSAQPGQPTAGSAAADLWSGFASDTDVPGLQDGHVRGTVEAGPPSETVVAAMVLLTVGLAGLLGGLVLTRLHRRRVLVGPPDRRHPSRGDAGGGPAA